MVLSGGWLAVVLLLLSIWFALLFRTFWEFLKARANGQTGLRNHLTIAGLGFSTIAVGSLLLLHLSWVSPTVSQYLGLTPIKMLAALLFWPTLAGLLLCVAGSGRVRFLGIGTTLITALWWFTLVMAAGISMGTPIARHPTEFLIPEAYVGWVYITYGEKGAIELEIKSRTRICRIPDIGVLRTSSALEQGWAKDEYFYYSKDGSLHVLKDTGWGKGGMIWGDSVDSHQGSGGTDPTQLTEMFFVGTEEQFRRAKPWQLPPPSNESKQKQD